MTDENTQNNQPQEETQTTEEIKETPVETTPATETTAVEEETAEEAKPAEAAKPEENTAPVGAAEETPAVETKLKLKPGMTVRVHQKIKETNSKGEEKERIQIFEGIIIAMKHGAGPTGTITVRKISGGIGVEKIYPIHSPNIAKIEPIKQATVRRAKLYFLRDWKKKLQEIFIK